MAAVDALPIPPSAADEAEIARRTLAAQVEGLHAKLPLAVGSILPAAGGAAWILWDRADRRALIVWLAAVAAVVGLRFAMLAAYRSRLPGPPEPWARRAVLGTTLTGLLWAAGLVALTPDASLPQRLAFFAILCGLVAGAAGTLSDHVPAFTGLHLPITLAAVGVMALSPEPIERSLGPLAVLYAVAIWLVARTSGQRLRDTLVLRFRNEALNAALEAEVRERTERLVRAERELAHASMLASVGSLAAGVAHDVNSPLSGVLSNLTWLERELGEPGRPPDRAAMLEAVAETRDAAQRVRDAVRHLSSVARGDTTPEAMDAGELLEACATVVTPAFRRRARVVRELPPLPPVLADRPSLAQVFLALLQRAARGFPEGGPEGVVRISGRAEGREVVLELADTGRALSPEEAARLAGSAFGDGDPGLALCHEIVVRLGGALVARSGEGGTVVSVRLPAAAPGAI